MTALSRVLLSALVVFFFPLVASSEIILLKDGRSIDAEEITIKDGMIEYKAKGIPGMVSMDRVKSIGAKTIDTPQKAPPSVQLPRPQPTPTPPAPAPTPSLNPIASIPEEKAKQDLKANLAAQYPNSFSTQKMLFDAGMRDYHYLCQMASHPVSDGIMRNLSSSYYPSFSTIWMLYKKNVKDYAELQKK